MGNSQFSRLHVYHRLWPLEPHCLQVQTVLLFVVAIILRENVSSFITAHIKSLHGLLFSFFELMIFRGEGKRWLELIT
jgi:hypothetical protein